MPSLVALSMQKLVDVLDERNSEEVMNSDGAEDIGDLDEVRGVPIGPSASYSMQLQADRVYSKPGQPHSSHGRALISRSDVAVSLFGVSSSSRWQFVSDKVRY